jgi:hypothetical protein
MGTMLLLEANKLTDNSGRDNRRAICLNNVKPAQRLAANQRNRLNTSERDYAVSRATVMRLCRLLPNRFWSHLNRELARRCTTRLKKATDAFPRGLAASSNSLLTFIA